MQTGPTERQQIEASIQREAKQQAPRDGEAIRTADIHATKAARRAVEQLEAERAAPRLRTKAAADEAVLTADEALGVHTKLPNVAALARTTTTVMGVATSLKTTMTHVSAALASQHLDGAQAVVRVAELAENAMTKARTDLDAERARLQQVHATTADRVIKALTPPPHLAAQVPEARALLRTMPDEQRYALIANARGDDIELLMYAVGGASAFLSCVAEGKRMELRTALLGMRDPEAMILENGIPAALTLLDKAEEGMRRLVRSVADPEAAAAIRKLGG